jgi:uncharacterized membrane protein
MQYAPFSGIKARKPVEFIQFVKKYKYAILAHVIIAFVAIVACLIVMAGLVPGMPAWSDYADIYYASKLLFSPEWTKIYDLQFFFPTFGSNVEFRYLPSILVLLYPLTLIDLNSSYLVFMSICCVLDVIVAYFVIKICQIVVPEYASSNIMKYLIIGFLICPLVFINFTDGQPESLAAFFLVISLYLMLTKRTLLGGVCLGISLIAKPMAIFIVVFLILLAKGIKNKFKIIIYVLLPLLFDLAFFVLNPFMVYNFIQRVLFGASQSTRTANPNSISLTNLIYTAFGTSTVFTSIVIALFVMAISIYCLSRVKDASKRIALSYATGMLCFILAYENSWGHDLIPVFPLIIVVTAYLSTSKQKKMTLVYWIYPFAQVSCNGILFLLNTYTGSSVMDWVVNFSIAAVGSIPILWMLLEIANSARFEGEKRLLLVE